MGEVNGFIAKNRADVEGLAGKKAIGYYKCETLEACDLVDFISMN